MGDWADGKIWAPMGSNKDPLEAKKQDELVEEIAALEHDQWIEWSKTVAPEVSEERRERWQKYWVPYEELSEEVKEYDRIWARKVITATLKAVVDGIEKLETYQHQILTYEYETINKADVLSILGMKEKK